MKLIRLTLLLSLTLTLASSCKPNEQEIYDKLPKNIQEHLNLIKSCCEKNAIGACHLYAKNLIKLKLTRKADKVLSKQCTIDAQDTGFFKNAACLTQGHLADGDWFAKNTFLNICKRGDGEGCIEYAFLLDPDDRGNKFEYLYYLQLSCILGSARGCALLISEPPSQLSVRFLKKTICLGRSACGMEKEILDASKTDDLTILRKSKSRNLRQLGSILSNSKTVKECGAMVSSDRITTDCLFYKMEFQKLFREEASKRSLGCKQDKSTEDCTWTKYYDAAIAGKPICD